MQKGSNINPVYADKLSKEQAEKKEKADEPVGEEEPTDEN
jgi:hypothetical protein